MANPEIPGTLPRTPARLREWDGRGLPAERAYAALVADLKAVADSPDLAILGRRLNYNVAGFRTLVIRTANRLPAGDVASYRDALIALDPRWGDAEYWKTIKAEGGRFTPFYFLSALDLRLGPDGWIVRAPPETTLYNDLLVRTFWISACVTVLCLLMGFPVAYVMAAAPTRLSNWLLVLVLLPFWTSLLVRTTASVILLQTEGLLNQLLLFLGLLSAPAKLIFNARLRHRAGLLHHAGAGGRTGGSDGQAHDDEDPRGSGSSSRPGWRRAPRSRRASPVARGATWRTA